MKKATCLTCHKKKITDINLKLYAYGECPECFEKCNKCGEEIVFLKICPKCQTFKPTHKKDEKEKGKLK